MTTIEIHYARTLEYYDGIQLFEAKDAIGGTYIAALLETGSDGDVYLLVGCEPQELRLFRNGGTDLRSLMTRSAVHGWYLADLVDLDKPLGLRPQEEDQIPGNLLPGPEFWITDAEVNHSVVARARESQNVVIQVTIEPTEGSAEHGIRASTLSNLLTRFQALIRQAVSQVTQDDIPTRDEARRRRESHLLDVIEMAPGSVRMTFQGVYTADPGELPPLARALETLDQLFSSTDETGADTDPFREHNDGTGKAYIELIKFLRTSKTSFSYTWAQPRSMRPSHRSMPLAGVNRLARDLPALLETSGATQEQEDLVIEGTLAMADEPKKRWRIRTAEGRSVAGSVDREGPSLSHLVINDRYRFHCSGMRTGGRGRPTTRPGLYLQNIEHLG